MIITAKVRFIDPICPVGLVLTYIINLQVFNSGFW